MPIPPDALASLASDYARAVTSIRGRRVQRLLKREFAGADDVWLVQAGSGLAVLGLSATGAAWCATDGRGPHAAVVVWRHGSAEGVRTRFDLLKDSLPARDRGAVPLVGICPQGRLQASAAPATAASRMLARATIGALA